MTLIDDFEDGNDDEWEQASSTAWEPAQAAAFSGDYGYRYDGSAVASNRLNISDQAYDQLSFYVRRTSGAALETLVEAGSVGKCVWDSNGDIYITDQDNNKYYPTTGLSQGSWYKIEFIPDYSNNTYNTVMRDSSGNKLGETGSISFNGGTASSISYFQLGGQSTQYDIDYITVNGTTLPPKVTGTVTNEGGSGLGDVLVELISGGGSSATVTEQ